jgi:hypothetical protein
MSSDECNCCARCCNCTLCGDYCGCTCICYDQFDSESELSSEGEDE